MKTLAAAFLAVLALPGLARANDKVIYVTDWFPGGDETYPYVAQKEGLWAKEGLDVTILVGRGSADVITRLATGAADVGSGAIAPLFNGLAESNVPVRATSSVFAKQADCLFVPTGSPIHKLIDLKGKTVATATFSSSNVFWPVVAKANGLDPDSVKLLKVDPTTLAALLAGGRVDATINWVTDGPETASVLKTAGKSLEVLPWSAMGLDGYGLSTFANDKMIKEHPEDVAKFVRGYMGGVKIALESCARASDDLKALSPQVDTAVAIEQCEVSNTLIKNEVSAKTGIGTFDPTLLHAAWTWVAKAQGYPMDKVDSESAVARQFVPKIDY